MNQDVKDFLCYGGQLERGSVEFGHTTDLIWKLADLRMDEQARYLHLGPDKMLEIDRAEHEMQEEDSLDEILSHPVLKKFGSVSYILKATLSHAWKLNPQVSPFLKLESFKARWYSLHLRRNEFPAQGFENEVWKAYESAQEFRKVSEEQPGSVYHWYFHQWKEASTEDQQKLLKDSHSLLWQSLIHEGKIMLTHPFMIRGYWIEHERVVKECDEYFKRKDRI